MTDNVFKTIAGKKNNFQKFTQKALSYKWINKKEFDAINTKLENDVLTIGVIGQMKCGKSTLLNALVFGEEILPSATTPMTASLSIITYGEEKKLEAEFYDRNEWEEIKFQSSRDLDGEDFEESTKAKIKAAKEIVKKSSAIEAEIRELLGTTKEDDFNKLIEYVGADGKYIAITKSVKISIPLDYLKGVEIVDTPGFNDPIVSREERTKAFLSKADAVIMLLYAGRAFDAVDKDIIYNQLKSIGLGKLLIGVNKYDLCIENESETEILNNVKGLLEQANREFHANSIAELVREKDPLLISANMALMSKMNFETIANDENWKFYYNDASKTFGINSQREMLEKSLFPGFEKELMNTIFKSKNEILLKKPVNFIKQRGEKKHLDLISELTQAKNNLRMANKPDDDLENLLKKTKRSEKKINRKVDRFEIEVEEILRKGIDDLTEKTEDLILKSKKTCKAIIDDHGIIIKENNLEEKLFSELEDFQIQLNRLFKKHNGILNSSFKREIGSFISAIDDIAESYDDEFDVQDYITLCKRELSHEILNLNCNDLMPSSEEEEDEEKSLLEKALLYSSAFADGFTLGTISGLTKITLNISTGKQDARDWVDSFYYSLDLKVIEEEILKNGKSIIENVRVKFIDDFLTPIIEELENLQDNKKNKEKEISDVTNRLTQLETDKKKIEEELKEIEVMEINL